MRETRRQSTRHCCLQAEDPFAASSGAAVQLAPLADTPTRVLGGNDHTDPNGITAAVPGLAALVDLDEADAPDGA